MVHFVVTGPGRSGSQMLLTALKQHPEIHCLGEVFLPVYFKQTYIPQGKLSVGEIVDNLCHSSDRNIFGFSVLYNELFRSTFTTGLIDELLQRRFRIIHVTRDNLLRRFLSHKLARSTHTWTDTGGNNPSILRMELSPVELLLDMRLTLYRSEKARRVLVHLPFLEISYESLCEDFPGNFARACEFLGAPYEDLRPKTFRQETLSLREAIVNYDRLKVFFALSKYRRFFDE